MRMRWSGVALLLLATACQTEPTKVTETPPQPWARTSALTDKSSKPLKMTDDTVVLDARSEFDYGLAHWSDSIHFGWKHLLKDPTKLYSLVDAKTASDRLSMMGIDIHTPVLVIGYGRKGEGDEGRLAWTLLYYGLEDVQTVSVDGLDVYFTHRQTPPHKSVAFWTADPRDQMIIDRDAFLGKFTKPHKGKIVLLDVRSKDEYFNRKGNHKTPDLGAMQMEWKEFYAEDGRPKKSMRSQLQNLGIKLDDEIITISNHGTRSGAAAYALAVLGFRNVRNFVEGWDSLAK
jgi:3-mercaptopyruvate sulfurtransferase SseA